MDENNHCLRTLGQAIKVAKSAIKGCKQVKENKKITQSEHGVRIRLSEAEKRYSERMSQSSEKVE